MNLPESTQKAAKFELVLQALKEANRILKEHERRIDQLERRIIVKTSAEDRSACGGMPAPQ